jgi:hypothetical protein
MKRHPMFETNKWMKGFTYVFIALWAAYLMIFGVMLGMGIDGEAYEAFDLINGGMIILLVLDFFQRFSMQETPAQQVKPFRLLPVRQVFLLNVFLARIGLNPLNLFWGFFLVPFGLLSVVPFFGLRVGGIPVWLVVMFAQFLLVFVWRTAMLKHTAWVAVHILIYAALILLHCAAEGPVVALPGLPGAGPLLLGVGRVGLCSVCRGRGRALPREPLAAAAPCLRRDCKVEQVGKVRSFRMGWLDRFGIIGEYIKLELKSTQRNKSCAGSSSRAAFSCSYSARRRPSPKFTTTPSCIRSICVYATRASRR